jgi:hypothetical protein
MRKGAWPRGRAPFVVVFYPSNPYTELS